jgi:hypothetical protein
MSDEFVIAEAFNDLNDRLVELSATTSDASNYYTATSEQVVFVEGTVETSQSDIYFVPVAGEISLEEAARLFAMGKTVTLKNGNNYYRVLSGLYVEGAHCELYAYDGQNGKRLPWA